MNSTIGWWGVFALSCLLMGMLAYSDVIDTKNHKRAAANPQLCERKIVSINQKVSHDVLQVEVKECDNVAHTWHIEGNYVICNCNEVTK